MKAVEISSTEWLPKPSSN